MPLYEYQCRQCHRRIEKIQSFSADPLTVCESCGGELERLISAPAFQFKGSGWYVTDYAKGSGPGSGSGSGSGSESGSESGSAPKADSPASAPETKPAGDSKPGATPAPADSGTTTKS